MKQYCFWSSIIILSILIIVTANEAYTICGSLIELPTVKLCLTASIAIIAILSIVIIGVSMIKSMSYNWTKLINIEDELAREKRKAHIKEIEHFLSENKEKPLLDDTIQQITEKLHKIK